MKLKELLDAAREADEKVRQMRGEMLSLLEDEADESKQTALAMRPALDAAVEAAVAANQLYVSMRDADLSPSPFPEGKGGDAARKFVPVPGASGKDAKKLTRAEFEAMSAADRMTFMLSDGKIVDSE